MNYRGHLWIIPDENQILQSLYERKVNMGLSHTYAIQEFSNLYKLGFEFSESDYQVAPYEITKLGHLVVKSEDYSSVLVFYLPTTITDRQLEWFYANKLELSKYNLIAAYSLEKGLDTEEWVEIQGLDQIQARMNKKNLKENNSNKIY